MKGVKALYLVAWPTACVALHVRSAPDVAGNLEPFRYEGVKALYIGHEHNGLRCSACPFCFSTCPGTSVPAWQSWHGTSFL